MTTVMLQAGDVIGIRFCDVANNIKFEVHFDTKKHPGQIVLKDVSGRSGNVLGGANQALFIEDYNCNDNKKDSCNTLLIRQQKTDATGAADECRSFSSFKKENSV